MLIMRIGIAADGIYVGTGSSWQGYAAPELFTG